MRDYGKVSPQFWVGKTGRSLRGNMEAQIVALYLMTSPHANMIGVFYCPIDYIAKETGLTMEGASKALRSLIEADFCTFEADSEYVFVHQFAFNQIGDELKPSDKRVQGVINELAKVPKGQCWQSFRARYSVPFNLPIEGQKDKPHRSPIEAPSKPETETETETEKGGKKSKSASLPFILPNWIQKEAWDGYIEMRKKKRAPMTDRALQLKVSELERFKDAGHDVAAILDKSTANTWTDLYEPKGGTVPRTEFAGAL